ncbi:Zinc finger CCCH domain-containing protein 18, partial [Ophiophagus hannah]
MTLLGGRRSRKKKPSNFWLAFDPIPCPRQEAFVLFFSPTSSLGIPTDRGKRREGKRKRGRGREEEVKREERGGKGKRKERGEREGRGRERGRERRREGKGREGKREGKKEEGKEEGKGRKRKERQKGREIKEEGKEEGKGRKVSPAPLISPDEPGYKLYNHLWRPLGVYAGGFQRWKEPGASVYLYTMVDPTKKRTPFQVKFTDGVQTTYLISFTNEFVLEADGFDPDQLKADSAFHPSEGQEADSVNRLASAMKRYITHQAFLSSSISQSLPKSLFIASMTLSIHLLLCYPLLLFPSVFQTSGSSPRSINPCSIQDARWGLSCSCEEKGSAACQPAIHMPVPTCNEEHQVGSRGRDLLPIRPVLLIFNHVNRREGKVREN